MSRNKQVSETHLLGLLLAVVGGFLDAYTYLCRGRVFANAQTGNIVLLGVNLTEQNWNRTFYYLMPIFAFVLGILVCEIIQTYFKWKKKLHWRQLIVLIEIFCLIVAGFLPSSAFDAPVNIMISFVCALQVEAFRKMNGNTYATTMCTGNLRSASQQLYLYRNLIYITVFNITTSFYFLFSEQVQAAFSPVFFIQKPYGFVHWGF